MGLYLRRFWLRATADKKRFRAFALLLGVGLIVWAKPMGLFLWARLRLLTDIPRTAMAEEELAAASVEEAPLRPLRASPVRIALAASPDRDPFAINGQFFPEPVILTEIHEPDQKSDPEPAETSAQAEARFVKRLEELVGRFELEAVMRGTAMAVINGVTRREGDLIPAIDAENLSFLLVEVQTRSVVLEYGDHRFEVHMSAPWDRPE